MTLHLGENNMAKIENDKGSGKIGEAYRKQDKAPRKGVPADDADEHVNKAIPGWDKGVPKGGAYRAQDKAPTGRGANGPTGSTVGPVISDWDKSPGDYKAYNAQDKWDGKSEKASLGFKRNSGMDYAGHFANEDVLRAGHNDAANMSDLMGGATPEPSPIPNKRSGDEDSSNMTQEEKRASAQKSMRKAFNYGNDE